MSDTRTNRPRRFNGSCEQSQLPIDPCVPTLPVRLNQRPLEKDPCNPITELQCDLSGLHRPNGGIPSASIIDGVIYKNKEIALSCYDVFGSDYKIIDGDINTVIVRSAEYSSLRSQEEVDSIAEIAALSRLNCVFGNKRITLQCEDADGILNNSGSITIEANIVTKKFDIAEYNLIRFSELGGTKLQEIASVLDNHVNDLAYIKGLQVLNCEWHNDLITVHCYDKIEGWKLVTIDNNDMYITTDTNERIRNHSIDITTATFRVSSDTQHQSLTKEGTDDLIYTLIYNSYYKRSSNEMAKASGLEQLECLFENVRTTLKCCESFNPSNEDPTLTLTHEDLQFYYDSHISSGNPVTSITSDNKGYPTSEPYDGVFDNIQPYFSRELNHYVRPWIGGRYDANIEVQKVNGEIVTDAELEEILLSCSTVDATIEITREFYNSQIYRTIHGLTLRCNNKYVTADYINQDGITIEAGIITSEIRGEAYNITIDLAKSRLECSWGNDPLDASSCKLDSEGNEVDPRSKGSKYNPTLPVYTNQFLSQISKEDANSQADAYNKSQLNCYWTNDAYDVRCPYCQFLDNGTVANNHIVNLAPILFRATNTLHLINDHCGNRLQNSMVHYYKLYEAEYQRRQLLSTSERGFLSEINTYLLNPPPGVVSITNPLTGESFNLPNYDIVPPSYTEDTNDDYLGALDPNEFIYNERKGMSFKRKTDNLQESDTKLYYDLDAFNNGVGDSYQSHLDCEIYVQPKQPRSIWVGNNLITQNIETTNARIQVLVEIGNFISNTSKLEANTLAESYALSQLNCYYENDLLDVRCEDCDFGDRELQDYLKADQDDDAGVYVFKQNENQISLYHPDPRWSAANALLVEQDCVLVRSPENGSVYVRSGLDSRGNIIENRCNHAPGALVRSIVNQGVFQSTKSKEEANSLGELFGNSQLDCYWENPDITRYCKFCGYNAPGHDMCFENTIRNKCDNSDQPCEDCSGSGDCPECYDERNRVDNTTKDLWNSKQSTSSVNEICEDVATTNIVSDAVNPKYSDVKLDCCCSKYVTGAITEVLINKGSTNSQESLLATLTLAKKLADTSLNCLFGSDAIEVSCDRDFPGTKVVHPGKCEIQAVGDVVHYVPKDTKTSYDSFNKAQELAEREAYELAKIKCNASAQWLNQTWKVDTGDYLGDFDLSETYFTNSETTEFSIRDAFIENYSLNVAGNLYPISLTLTYHNIGNEATAYLNNPDGYSFTKFIYDSTHQVIYDLVNYKKFNCIYIKRSFFKTIHSFDFTTSSPIDNFTIVDTNTPNLFFLINTNIVLYNSALIYRLPVNLTGPTIPKTLVESPDLVGLKTNLFENTYCISDCDWCLGPVVGNLYNSQKLRYTSIVKTNLTSKFGTVYSSADKDCDGPSQVSAIVDLTKSITSGHYRPVMPIIQVASVHVGGYQFNLQEKHGSHFNYSNVPLAIQPDTTGFTFSLSEYIGSIGVSLIGIVRDCGDIVQDDYSLLRNRWLTNDKSTSGPLVYFENISDPENDVLTRSYQTISENIVNITFDWFLYKDKIVNFYLCPFAWHSGCSKLTCAVWDHHYSGSYWKGTSFCPKQWETHNHYSNLGILSVKSSFNIASSQAVAIKPSTKASIISSPCINI